MNKAIHHSQKEHLFCKIVKLGRDVVDNGNLNGNFKMLFLAVMKNLVRNTWIKI